MGEPVIPGEAERACALDMAREALDQVRNDEAVHHGPITTVVLAELVVWQHDELERMRAVYEAAVAWRDTWRHRRPFGTEDKAVALVDAVDAAQKEPR